MDIKENRKIEIDIIKALAIILMVAAHAGSPGYSFIYLFHMPVFIIASGYFFKNIYADDATSLFIFVAKKIKTLWFPFFIWNAIYSVFHNVFLKLNIYTDDSLIFDFCTGKYINLTRFWSRRQMIENILRGITFQGGTQLGGAFWFLQVLFEVSVLYAIVDYVLKRFFNKDNVYILQSVVSICLLILGWLCNLKSFQVNNYMVDASCYFMYHLGYTFSILNKKISLKNDLQKQPHIWKSAIIAGTMLFLLLYLKTMGNVDVGNNTYPNPLFLIISSTAGWIFLYSLSKVFKRVAILNDILSCIGQNTLPIMILHFLSFKLINLVVCFVYDMPLCCIAAFPTICGRKDFWWIAYTVCGIGLPIFINTIWRLTKRNIHFPGPKNS